nr:MAG TPA: hypothetical protein [Caudoviricetes sp.]
MFSAICRSWSGVFPCTIFNACCARGSRPAICCISIIGFPPVRARLIKLKIGLFIIVFCPPALFRGQLRPQRVKVGFCSVLYRRGLFRCEEFEIKEVGSACLLIKAFQVDHPVPDVRHNDAERKVVRARGNSLFAACDRLADVSGSNLLHGLRSLISTVKLLWLLVVVFHRFTSFLPPLSHKKRGLTHRLALNNPSIIHHSIAAAILSLIDRIRRSTFSVPYSSVSVCMAKEICKTLMPFARRRKIFSSSSVKPQSRSNCSRSSRGNCSLFFVPGVVKLRRMLSVVIGYTLHIRFKKCLCEAFRRLDAIDAAECFYGFLHLFFLRNVGLQGFKEKAFCLLWNRKAISKKICRFLYLKLLRLLFVFVELLKYLIDAGRGKSRDNTDGNSSQVVCGREVRHNVQRQHAERRANNATDDGNPFVIDCLDVLDGNADEVGNHDDRHASSQAEDVFHVYSS